MSDVTTDKYAICLDCGVEHEDRAAMEKHMHDTVTPTGDLGITARGHRSRVVNPTPEEVEARRITGIIDRTIEDALNEAFEDLDRSVRRGDITEAAVTKQIRNYPDFAEGWAEWCNESNG